MSSLNINANLNMTKRGIPIESSIDLQISNNNNNFRTLQKRRDWIHGKLNSDILAWLQEFKTL